MAVLGAVVRRVLSVAKLQSQSLQIHFKSKQQYTITNSSNPLLSKLLQLPNSKIKSTLDSDLNSSQFPFDALVTALASSSPEKARLVLEWRLDCMLKQNEIDHVHYSNLISLCAKIHNVSLAMRVFTSMEGNGIIPNTTVFNSLIQVCLSSISNVLTALSLFEIMDISEFCKPDSQTYDTFVLGFSNLRDVVKMQAWFAAKKAAGYTANVQNYECLISTCVKTKDLDKADRLFDEMMSMGVMPSAAILEWVLEGLCKRRDCDRVRGFLNFLLECRFEFNGNMIEKIVELYSELGKVDEMEKLLDICAEFNQVGETLSRLHCGIIRFYAKADRLDDVEYSVGRMTSSGMLFRSPDDVEKVISSYFRKEAYDRLDLFLEHVKGYHKLTRSTYDLLVAGYRRAGLAEKLELVMLDMKLAD
ncbi:pentatricopeptide repeat-containing protein At2g30780 [Ricinus communis]|uniref:Pentatricopeptide repeat-containing protein, putative n=1 Tax=Ricinus communis TaxID=3988 RepID=B9RS57_RICCO|nr:pentatricopeptide repeat-containing protein At2g30780 [Ricinus communis]EEF45917.1 pentatricopeptide repeat-containing protein, putative [Ricinus communis]|eukprot:XP_002516576.1 pentatricopeptide repeat-containing protein At2g30780 [Ricinus communis]